MSRLLVISSDCHAGALPADYMPYLDREFHQAAEKWWLQYAREMMARVGTFFDQEAAADFAEKAGNEGSGKFQQDAMRVARQASDEQLREFLADANSAIAPRRGEYDAAVRLRELEEDGIAAEVVFPQMAPFGAGLMMYRHQVTPAQRAAGNRAYNRFLADLCRTNPGRHAGVAVIDVDDIAATVREIRSCHALGLFGGVLLPSHTGDQPYYHHYQRYAPLWEVCEELNLPVHAHSGWSPDYGDVPSATPMYISEVDMWAHRPFTALLWSGAFERHPQLKMVFTETGCSWILETLRTLDFKANNPIFAHFTRDLSLTPREYFQRNCYIGASFLPRHEIGDRYRIGVDKLMWGSDYPHMEGTWPNTMDRLRETFHDVDEGEIRDIMGNTAVEVYGFDRAQLRQVADRIGPELEQITVAPREVAA